MENATLAATHWTPESPTTVPRPLPFLFPLLPPDPVSLFRPLSLSYAGGWAHGSIMAAVALQRTTSGGWGSGLSKSVAYDRYYARRTALQRQAAKGQGAQGRVLGVETLPFIIIMFL